MKMIFLSRPAILSRSHRAHLDRWREALLGRDCQVVELERGEYASTPWRQLRYVIGASEGVVVFGAAQLEADTAVWRAGTSESVRTRLVWAAPWMQIEAGMAAMAGVPVLVVADSGVTEGVFDPAAWGESVFGASLALEPENQGGFRLWLHEVGIRHAYGEIQRMTLA